MIKLITSKRLKQLERDSDMLYAVKQEIDTVKHWCAADSPEIGFTMLYLQALYKKQFTISISTFRDKIRSGVTFKIFCDKERE